MIPLAYFGWRPAAALLAITCVAAGLACRTAKAPASGIDLAGMDKSVAPGDDFNVYANGGWAKSTPIPEDKASYGIFSVLADQTRQRTLGLIEDAGKAGAAAGSNEQKIADFYASYMDEAGIEAKGVAPLKAQLDAVAGIATRADLSRSIGSSLRADVDPLNSTNFETDNLLGVFVAQGTMDPSKNYPYLLQGGLGLPDRDYYLSDNKHMAEVREKYKAHIEATFKLAGLDDAAARARRVFELETKIARAHATRVESQDVAGVAKWKREELAAKAPGLDWPVLLEAAGLKDAPEFLVWHPKAVPGLAALAAKEPIEAWKDYLAFHSVEQAGAYLPKAFVDERFNFYGKVLNGVPQLRPRWQRGVDNTDAALGDAVGQLYVKRYFPPETKAKVQAMVQDLVRAFGKRIDALAWMTPETKAKAKQKLDTLIVGVGYPERWRDYAGLEIVKGDAVGNARRAGLHEYRHQLAKLGQPVDRSEWWMTPQTVNAVNLPLQNALNFPAAILQPPYFDAAADAAHNYGAMGAIIGHEISHSFDDQGAQFDAEGRLANWWTKDDFAHFKSAGEALAAQFDAYHPFADLAINGHQTLSENIADVAGLLAAYDAYRLSLNGQSDAVKDGLGGDQRFFLSYGQSWRTKTREAAMRRAIATDGHAPGEFRALSVRNLDAWYDAFAVKSGQKLYLAPDARVKVW